MLLYPILYYNVITLNVGCIYPIVSTQSSLKSTYSTELLIKPGVEGREGRVRAGG